MNIDYTAISEVSESNDIISVELEAKITSLNESVQLVASTIFETAEAASKIGVEENLVQIADAVSAALVDVRANVTREQMIFALCALLQHETEIAMIDIDSAIRSQDKK